MLQRTVEPEWLDALPPADPRAVESRRDLGRVNRIMGHARIIGRSLDGHLATRSPRIADLGAGDGTLLLAIAEKLRLRDARIALVDRQPVVSERTQQRYRDRGCSVTVDRADIFDWLGRANERYDAIVTNLFLHHFDDAMLARLLAAAARCTNLFVACEPRRSGFPLAASRLLGCVGCNDVTRHDAVLSVRAGFAEAELSALWPQQSGWILEERPAGLFSHVLVAHRA